MEEIKLSKKVLPDGRTIVYTTTPGVVLYSEYEPSPYEFTGVVNRAWIEAADAVGRQYTRREIKQGWPLKMEPHRLANLQHPQDSTGQTYINTALPGACKAARLPYTAYEHHDYALLPNGGRQLIEVWTDYAITAPTFAAWLARQGEEPSAHIAAWFKAVGVSLPPVAPESMPKAAPVEAGAGAGAGAEEAMVPQILQPEQAENLPKAIPQEQTLEGLIGWFDATMSADSHLKMPDVRPINAAMLLCQFNPADDTDTRENALTRTNDATCPVDLKLLLAHFEAVSRTDPKPRKLIDWWRIARDAKLKYHPWIDLYIKASGLNAPAQPVDIEPASVVADSASGGVEPWKLKAQERAREIIKRDKTRDLYPSQINIAHEIAAEFRKDGVIGDGGKPLTGGYIKRHALNGISSAQSKQLSTAISRGK